MKPTIALFLLAPLLPSADGPQHFRVTAAFASASKGQAHGNLAVTFVVQDPDLRINQDPAPRLKLDPAQKILVDKQPPPAKANPTFDPATAKYYDLTFPLLFPVAVDAAARPGTHNVKGTVSYFYCSKREAWCRKGAAEVEFPVRVP